MADLYIRRGQMVFGSHGVRLGRVLQADESGFVVEKGLVFTEDYPVKYEDIESVKDDGVHLRIPGSALIPEEEVGPWEPARDPIGTADGTDIEPLRAGMAEIDERQHPERAVAAAAGDAPSRGERRRREALAREARLHAKARESGRGTAQPSGGEPARSASAQGDTEVKEHIEEEIEDFEREAACSKSRAADDPLLQAQRAAQRRASAGAAPSSGERRATAGDRRKEATAATAVPPAPPAVGTAPPEARGKPPKPAPGRVRVDYGAVAPGALKAMVRLESYARSSGLERSLLELVRLRASQMNGCGFCIDMHTKDARREGETEQRLYTLQVWDETTFFTERERAAMAWTEAVTRLGPDHVSDAVFRRAREQFTEAELVNLTMAIIAINGWNRLAIAFRTEPGSYQPPGASASASR